MGLFFTLSFFEPGPGTGLSPSVASYFKPLRATKLLIDKGEGHRGLVHVRSPLLVESRLISFPTAKKN